MRETQIEKLWEWAHPETIIECDECPSNEGAAMDSADAAEVFYDDGWRVSGGKCLCPLCVGNKKKK